MITRAPKYVKTLQAVYLRLVLFASSYIPSYFLKDFFWCGPFLKSLLNLLQFITCFKAWSLWPSQLPDQGSNSYPFCTGRWNFNHWNTRQVPYFFLKRKRPRYNTTTHPSGRLKWNRHKKLKSWIFEDFSLCRFFIFSHFIHLLPKKAVSAEKARTQSQSDLGPAGSHTEGHRVSTAGAVVGARQLRFRS